MERLTKMIYGYAHGAEGISKDRLTGRYFRGEFEATACVEKLAEYENLEEQGLLLKLPCKMGSEVWYIDKYGNGFPTKIVRGTVDGLLWFRTCGFALNCVWNNPIMGHFAYCRREMPFSEIGNSVFLTQEEAEQALKEISAVE